MNTNTNTTRHYIIDQGQVTEYAPGASLPDADSYGDLWVVVNARDEDAALDLVSVLDGARTWEIRMMSIDLLRTCAREVRTVVAMHCGLTQVLCEDVAEDLGDLGLSETSIQWVRERACTSMAEALAELADALEHSIAVGSAMRHDAELISSALTA